MKNKLLLGLAIIALLSIGAWTGYAQRDKPSGVSYEYQVLPDPTETGSMDDGIKKLNELGAQGWELVGVSRGQNLTPMIYLKRTKR
jgi:hypothetical protein